MSLNVPLITDQHYHIYSDYSWPPYQLSASNHHTHSLFICPPRPPPRTGFYSAPQDVPVRVRCQGPGPRAGTADLNNAPPPAPADHVIRSTAARARMSRLARHVTLTRYWNALNPGAKLDRFQHRTSL